MVLNSNEERIPPKTVVKVFAYLRLCEVQNQNWTYVFGTAAEHGENADFTLILETKYKLFICKYLHG